MLGGTRQSTPGCREGIRRCRLNKNVCIRSIIYSITIMKEVDKELFQRGVTTVNI